MNFKAGTWNVICPVCGFQYKSDQMKLRWDGQWVCESDWETKHPQELVRLLSKEKSVPFAFPPGDEPNVGPNYQYPLEPVPPGTFNNGL